MHACINCCFCSGAQNEDDGGFFRSSRLQHVLPNFGKALMSRESQAHPRGQGTAEDNECVLEARHSKGMA